MAISKRNGMIGILFLVFIFFAIFMVFLAYTFFSLQDQLSGGGFSLNEGNEDGIALVEIKGMILDSKKAVEELQKAEESKKIKAILVRIDSPGGAVGPTQEIYDEIIRIDQIKPIFASFGSIAASGGYYIGAAARKIYSNSGTLTGSIGVIMQFMNLSKLYDWAKVSTETIKAGLYKDAGNPARSITEEERKLLNDMIKNVHQRFKDDILRVRKGRIKGKIDDLAQGQVFSGQGAKDLGLVDEIGSQWAAARDLQNLVGLKGKLNLLPMKSKKKFSLFELFDSLDDSVQNFKYGLMLNNVPLLIYGPR